MLELPTLRPNIWTFALFEHTDARTIECVSWEAEHRGHSPGAFDFMSGPIRAMHLVLGGHPELLDGRVRGSEFSEIAGIQGGTQRRLTLRPSNPDLIDPLVAEKWREAMAAVEQGMRRSLGALGHVETSVSELGCQRLALGYGPGFLTIIGGPEVAPPVPRGPGRIVDLGPVEMRPRAVLKA